MTSKLAAYSELVAARKKCEACPCLTNPSKYPELDSEHIGPYSRWQGNLNSDLLVVGQDSSDLNTYLHHGGDWPGESVQTNLVLVDLLRAAGLEITPPKRDIPDDRLFFTNAVLCLKPTDPAKRRSMQGAVQAGYVQTCGSKFLRPTIELIRPRAVATLGLSALSATLTAFGIIKPKGLLSLIDSARTFDLPCNTRVFPMCHPNRTVLNTTRSISKQKGDWQRLGNWLAAT